MTDAEPWNEDQLAAMRSILLNWSNISRGDTSIILKCVCNSAATVLTVHDSVHARYWKQLVRIGWAEQLYSPSDPYDHDPETLAFRLLPGAERPLSHFLVYYDLVNMGACTPANDAQALQTYKESSGGAVEGGKRSPALERTQTLIAPRFAVQAWSLLAILLVGVAIGKAISE